MTNTTNYGLKKPDQTDNYNVDDINANADIIDAQMKTNADAAAAVQTSLNNLWTVVHTW